MTVETTTNRVTYTGDGSTTAFPVTFAFYDDTDLEVIERTIATGAETTKTLTTHYTVSGGDGSTGTVTAVAAPTATEQWIIRRALPKTQASDLPVAGALPSGTVEEMADRAVMLLQEAQEERDRSLKIPKTDGSLTTTLPSSVNRASKYLSFDPSGNVTASQNVGEWEGTWTTGTAYIKNDIVKNSSNDNVYVALTDHTAGASIAADIAAGNLQLVIDVAAAATSETNAATSETNASTSAINAATSETNAATSATNAATSETNAATSATSAAASETNAAASAVDAAAAASLDLTAVDAIVASETPVDLLLYDTSKDSDGGAWIDRVRHTSHYNETLNTATRGATRKFPALALIAAETDTVTIYDATDSDLPMWMVFNGVGGNGGIRNMGNEAVTAVAMLDGKMAVVMDQGGATVVDFVADRHNHYELSGKKEYLGKIVDRNGTPGWFTADASQPIVDTQVQDVAITVFPGAPIDPATGLPVPTIALATYGGISVINNNGTVADLTATSDGTNNYTSVQFGPHGVVSASLASTNQRLFIWDNIQSDDGAAPDHRYAKLVANRPAILTHSDFTAPHIWLGDWFVKGGTAGVSIVWPDFVTFADGMVAYITSIYATPFIQGKPELCLAGDTLTDRSYAGTAVIDNGSATFAAVATGAELEATTATGGTITVTVTTGGECYGWEKVGGNWLFRRAIADWTGVSEAGGTLTIADTTVFTRLVYVNGAGPSSAQLDLIYALDRHLFKDDADMLLSGTSNRSHALSYDPDSDRLLVGTGDGTSFFRGLERVEYVDLAGTPTSDDIKAVAGARGAYTIGTAAEIAIYIPALNLREELEKARTNMQIDLDVPSQAEAEAGTAEDERVWTAQRVQQAIEALGATTNFIGGLRLSNGTDGDHDIDIATGKCRDDEDAVYMVRSSVLTKQIDAAWALGDDTGGLDTGSVAADTTYAMWQIRRSGTGVVDALFSLSFSSPTMPTNYDQKRLIGFVVTDGSANIIAFTQRDNYFRFTGDVIADVADTSITDNTFEDAALSVPPDCIAHVYFNVKRPGNNQNSFIRGTIRTNGAADASDTLESAVIVKGDPGAGYTNDITTTVGVLVDGTSKVQYAADSSEVDALEIYISTFACTMLTRNDP